MKKKLEGAYIPDKLTRKEKVLVGLSGGLDAFVAAYLLKIQKYDLIAVSVLNNWDNWEGNSSSILSCGIDQAKLEVIKEFCQRLNIPHVMVKASAEFKDGVIEEWMADRLTGKKPKQCWNCHELRMRILHEKMKEAGAKHLATGHFAKLFHQDGGMVFVHTSNDEEHDQSALLSRLPHHILENLLLPLSDLTKKEVVKLAENFGIKEEEKKIHMHDCLPWGPEMRAIFEKLVPGKLRLPGEMISEEGHSFDPHEGVFEHSYGEPHDYKEVGKNIKGFIGSYSHQEKRILVMDEAFFIRNKLHLVDCHFSEGTSWIEPIKGYVVKGEQFFECWIHPKSLSSAFIEMNESAFFLEGEVLSVVKKKGKNSKIYLTGKVKFLPQEPVVPEGETPRVPKMDCTRDY